MLELLFGAWPVVVAGAVILSLISRSRRSLKEVRRLALRHGLNLRQGEGPGTFLANGSVKGRPVFFQSRWVRTGNQRHIQTELLVDVQAPLPGRMSLSAEGLGTQLLKWLGEPDIQVGDPRLDKALLIQGHAPEVRALLRDAPLREALLRWFARYPTGKIHDGQVTVLLQGSAAGRLEPMMRDAVALAEVLAQAVARRNPPATAPRSDALPVPIRLPAGPRSKPTQLLPAPPEAPAPPRPAPVAPVAPVEDPDPLHLLYAARHDRLPREAALQAALGRRYAFTLDIRDVAWTSGLFLPSEIQGGRTAAGTLQGSETEVAVRFPAGRNAEIDALGRAEERPRLLPVTATLSQWDELYRRPLLDALPQG